MSNADLIARVRKLADTANISASACDDIRDLCSALEASEAEVEMATELLARLSLEHGRGHVGGFEGCKECLILSDWMNKIRGARP